MIFWPKLGYGGVTTKVSGAWMRPLKKHLFQSYWIGHTYSFVFPVTTSLSMAFYVSINRIGSVIQFSIQTKGKKLFSTSKCSCSSLVYQYRALFQHVSPRLLSSFSSPKRHLETIMIYDWIELRMVYLN